MSADSDALDRLVVTIVSVRRQLGVRAYRRALVEARRAVAALVLREAEGRAGGRGCGSPNGRVIQWGPAVKAIAELRSNRGEEFNK